MKIHSLSSIIAIPFVVLSFYTGYQVFFLDNETMFPFLLIFVIVIMIIYMFSPQINYAWYRNHPQELNIKEKTFLSNISSFYNSLSPDDKIKFEHRIYIFVRAKDFKLITKEKNELPYDMKLVVATNAIQVSFGQEDFLFKDFDRYFIYEHPFPTPDKKFLHSIEVNFEDKMAIFDMKTLIKGLNTRNHIFNIGIFAFVSIYRHQNPYSYFQKTKLDDFWQKAETAYLIDKQSIIKTIGYEPDSFYDIVFTLFFMYPNLSKSAFPNLYDEFLKIFNCNYSGRVH